MKHTVRVRVVHRCRCGAAHETLEAAGEWRGRDLTVHFPHFMRVEAGSSLELTILADEVTTESGG